MATARQRQQRVARQSAGVPGSCWWSRRLPACGSYLHFRDRVSSDDANVDGHISAIAPKITGNVIEVPVLDNQTVKAGDVLVRIDPRDYQAARGRRQGGAGSRPRASCRRRT